MFQRTIQAVGLQSTPRPQPSGFGAMMWSWWGSPSAMQAGSCFHAAEDDRTMLDVWDPKINYKNWTQKKWIQNLNHLGIQFPAAIGRWFANSAAANLDAGRGSRAGGHADSCGSPSAHRRVPSEHLCHLAVSWDQPIQSFSWNMLFKCVQKCWIHFNLDETPLKLAHLINHLPKSFSRTQAMLASSLLEFVEHLERQHRSPPGKTLRLVIGSGDTVPVPLHARFRELCLGTG